MIDYTVLVDTWFHLTYAGWLKWSCFVLWKIGRYGLSRIKLRDNFTQITVPCSLKYRFSHLSKCDWNSHENSMRMWPFLRYTWSTLIPVPKFCQNKSPRTIVLCDFKTLFCNLLGRSHWLQILFLHRVTVAESLYLRNVRCPLTITEKSLWVLNQIYI